LAALHHSLVWPGELKMIRSLTAVVLSLITACASSAGDDELAGETSDDAALDGKADASDAGVYTYFEIWTDLRECTAPRCGGFFLRRLNRTSTQCHDGASRSACYAPELDWSQSGLSITLQARLIDASNRTAVSWGAIGLVRGRFAAKSYPGLGNLGRFIVTEAWVAENDSISDGVFVKAHDNGVRCIQAPCPSIGERALNTSRSASIHGIAWSVGGFTSQQVSNFWTDLAKPHGVILAGDRFAYRQNGQWAKARTATAVYRRLVDNGCFVGGCSSHICSEEEGAVSTCEWREQYACYQTTTCERQPEGHCGWTPTPELQACIAANP
jgi:hypothetical protein